MIRMALLALVPMIALGTLVGACSDDTTNVTTQDISMPMPKDMAIGPDLAPAHD
jgi:hypothetical protein